jgi:proline iminopeptidase
MQSIPYMQGMLEVAGGDLIYWELCGNPEGRPAVVVHGGPGSGCQPWHRQLFDLQSYHVVVLARLGAGDRE